MKAIILEIITRLKIKKQDMIFLSIKLLVGVSKSSYVSATPVNKYNDLKNQLALAYSQDYDAFESLDTKQYCNHLS